MQWQVVQAQDFSQACSISDGFVHAASGEFLGLFVYVFNGLFYRVNIVTLCNLAQVRGGGVDSLTFCGA